MVIRFGVVPRPQLNPPAVTPIHTPAVHTSFCVFGSTSSHGVPFGSSSNSHPKIGLHKPVPHELVRKEQSASESQEGGTANAGVPIPAISTRAKVPARSLIIFNNKELS